VELKRASRQWTGKRNGVAFDDALTAEHARAADIDKLGIFGK
jgi:hypothetical protein